MDYDPLVLGVKRELGKLEERKDSDLESRGTWEHESLAQIKIKLFRGHKEACTSCQFCGFNDEKLLTAGEDATIKLWDFTTGQLLNNYTNGHSMNITKARTGPDNRMMVSSGWDKKVNMWDLETGKVLWTGYHEGMVTCCNYSHDGKYVVSGSDFDNSLKVWDSFNGELISSVENFHMSTITSVMFNPHDDRVVTTSMDMSTKFFDLKTRVNTITLKNHINIVSDASFTTDERKLATVSWDKNIAYYDISTGMYRSTGPSMQEKAHEGCVSCCEFSEDGLTLATGGYDMCVCLWDVDNNVQKLKLQGHTDWIEDIAMSKNDCWLMTASRDKTVRVWNIENADNIPMVQEKRKNIGLNMFKCSQCGKPFSLSEEDVQGDYQLCVFCRLEQVRERDTMDRAVEEKLQT